MTRLSQIRVVYAYKFAQELLGITRSCCINYFADRNVDLVEIFSLQTFLKMIPLTIIETPLIRESCKKSRNLTSPGAMDRLGQPRTDYNRSKMVYPLNSATLVLSTCFVSFIPTPEPRPFHFSICNRFE